MFERREEGLLLDVIDAVLIPQEAPGDGPHEPAVSQESFEVCQTCASDSFVTSSIPHCGPPLPAECISLAGVAPAASITGLAADQET